jgi:gliding motility-associated lipoprotein GldH
MKPYIASLFLFVMLLCLSCDKDYAFTQLNTIPDSGWTYQDTLKYEFEVGDTSSLYDLYLEIDYSTSFAYQNVYVNVYTGNNIAAMKKTQLSLDLSNKLGIWKGDCSEENCVYLLPLQKSIFFNQTGTQLFWIEQFSRSENLKGIESIKLVGDKIGDRLDQK